MFNLKSAVGVLFFVVSAGYLNTPPLAKPSNSPSAKAAAKLAKNPPAGWINHYLPADRYKVAGKVWQVVSTELDTYYHRPDSH